jgi:hypothetical protein
MENPYLESRMAVAAGPFFLGHDLVGKPVSTFPDHALKRRDTRPITRPWQREKSVKMMKSRKCGALVAGVMMRVSVAAEAATTGPDGEHPSTRDMTVGQPRDERVFAPPRGGEIAYIWRR